VETEQLVRFWQTIILGEPAYTGNPFPLHMRMPLQQKHFDAGLQPHFRPYFS
jgi:hemoglobin